MSTAPSPAPTASGGLTDNTAGLLAYITIIPAIIFLVMEPYNKNKFIRFHAFQNVFLFVGWIALHVILVVPLLGWAVYMIGGLALFVGWLVALIKAGQGQKFKLPIIGELAEKQANA